MHKNITSDAKCPVEHDICNKPNILLSSSPGRLRWKVNSSKVSTPIETEGAVIAGDTEDVYACCGPNRGSVLSLAWWVQASPCWVQGTGERCTERRANEQVLAFLASRLLIGDTP